MTHCALPITINLSINNTLDVIHLTHPGGSFALWSTKRMKLIGGYDYLAVKKRKHGGGTLWRLIQSRLSL
jgi:hypothetical protein